MKNSIIKNLRLAFALALVLMFSGMSFATNGKLSGSGTQTSPYKISDAADLKAFAKLVNDEIQTDAWAELTANIDMNFGKTVLNEKGELHNKGEGLEKWTPIKKFSGHFDGKNHTIRGLYYDDETEKYVGLFGSTSISGAIVQNVGVIDSYFKGGECVGGVIGKAYGSLVSGVYNTGSVNGVSIVGGVVGYAQEVSVSDVYNTGAVNGGSDVGGVVGSLQVNSSISNSHNMGVVTGEASVGGVVGVLGASINASYNMGAVDGKNFVGGVVGYAGVSSVHGNFNAGTVKGEDYVGGVIGYALGPSVNDNSNMGAVNGIDYVGGVVGSSCGNNVGGVIYEANISNVYNTGSVNGGIYVGGVAGENADIAKNIYNTGSVNAGNYVGGVVGCNRGSVSDSYNMGDVNGKHNNVGGVIGINTDIVNNVYNMGSVKGLSFVGGVFGEESEDASSSDGFYAISMCPSCGGAINGVDDVKNNVVGLTNEEFAEKKIAYYIAFFDSDGKTVLQQGFVQPNEVPVPPSLTVKEDNVYYHYFVKWTPEIATATENVTYQAVIDSSLKRLDVTVEMYDGNSVVLKTPSPCIDATALKLEYNDKIMAVSEIRNFKLTGGMSYKLLLGVSAKKDEACQEDDYVKAIKNSDSDVKIFVNGVDSENSLNAANNYLTGFYFSGVVSYLITFLDSDGETVLKKSGVAPDAMPVPPAIPTVDDETYHYVVGWDKEIVAATENATYTLVKTSIPWATAGLLGSGTEADPYLIGNAQALRDFAAKVNSGEETSAWAVLKADIDLNPGKKVLNDDGTLYNKGKGLEEWTPIGQIGSPYVGIFDGKGHVVSGLYFNKDADDYVGLFGFISGSETKVQKVGVVDSYFNGRQYVGGVVGYNKAGYVNYVYHTGSVNGNTSVGGVVGCNRISNGGIVQDVYGVGFVKGTSNVGGVVGSNQAKVSRGYYSTSSCPSCGGAINGVDDTTKNVIGKTSEELLDGSSLSFVFGTWILGAKGENPKQDTLYYPYLKVFSPGPYVLGAVKKYTISVAVNDKKKGSVTGAGEYEYGTEIELSATAKEGYKFSNWQDDVKDAKRKITVTDDKTYTAKFEKLPDSSSSKNSDNDEKSDSKEKSSSSSSKEKSGKKIGIVAAAQVQQFHVAVSGRMLSVAGIRPNTSVEVFDMQGNKVKSVVATSANAAFILSDAGVYVVKNGNFVSRVNIR